MGRQVSLSDLRKIIQESLDEKTFPPEVQVIRDFLRERGDGMTLPSPDSKEWVALLAQQFSSIDAGMRQIAQDAWNHLPDSMAIVESKFMPVDDPRWLALATRILDLIISRTDYQLNGEPPDPEQFLDPPEESEYEAVERAVRYTDAWLTGGAPADEMRTLARLLRYYADINVTIDNLGDVKPAVRLAEEIIECTFGDGQSPWNVAHHAIWGAVLAGVADDDLLSVVRGFNPNTSLDEEGP